MTFAWLAAIVAFALIEAFTAQLVSIWFAGGAVAAFIGTFFGANSLTQWILFIAISTILLILTKPLVKKIVNRPPEKTNMDANIGKITIVTKMINNIAEMGEVKLNGIPWSARSADNEPINAGETVVVEKVEGVKLIVRRQS